MKEKLARLPQFVKIGCGVTSGCLFLIVLWNLCVAGLPSGSQPSKTKCTSSISNLSASNLVGTWVTGVPKHNDTLIIKADGTYKQIVHVEFTELPPLDYESNWQPWYLEYSADKVPYLHLKGFAFCGVNPNIPCKVRDDSGYDFCQDKYLPMKGEGILIVQGALDKNKQYYFLDYPLGSENSYMYRFQEP